MSDFQALPPPPGGDQNKAAGLLVSTIFTTILALITVVMRVYSRVVVIRNVGWDDYTIVIATASKAVRSKQTSPADRAQVMVVVTLGLTVHSIHHGLGRHMYYLSLDDLTLIGLEYHVIEIFYTIDTALIKISACLCLLRIMARGTSKFLHWFLYIMMVLVAVLCVATACVILFQCFPVQSGWDPRVKGKCLSFPSILGVGYAQNGECYDGTKPGITITLW